MLQMFVIHELQVFRMVTAEAVIFRELVDLLGQEISSPAAVWDPGFASGEGKRLWIKMISFIFNLKTKHKITSTHARTHTHTHARTHIHTHAHTHAHTIQMHTTKLKGSDVFKKKTNFVFYHLKW